MKRSPADVAFSQCVRERAEYKCERCNKQYDPKSLGLHCSHIFSRRHRTIRWCAENAQALCFACHEWFGGNPVDSGKWIEELLGEGDIQLLREKMREKIKVSKVDEKAIAEHYRKEFKKLRDKRNAGITGYLDFDSWN